MRIPIRYNPLGNGGGTFAGAVEGTRGCFLYLGNDNYFRSAMSMSDVYLANDTLRLEAWSGGTASDVRLYGGSATAHTGALIQGANLSNEASMVADGGTVRGVIVANGTGFASSGGSLEQVELVGRYVSAVCGTSGHIADVTFNGSGQGLAIDGGTAERVNMSRMGGSSGWIDVSSGLVRDVAMSGNECRIQLQHGGTAEDVRIDTGYVTFGDPNAVCKGLVLGGPGAAVYYSRGYPPYNLAGITVRDGAYIDVFAGENLKDNRIEGTGDHGLFSASGKYISGGWWNSLHATARCSVSNVWIGRYADFQAEGTANLVRLSSSCTMSVANGCKVDDVDHMGDGQWYRLYAMNRAAVSGIRMTNGTVWANNATVGNVHGSPYVELSNYAVLDGATGATGGYFDVNPYCTARNITCGTSGRIAYYDYASIDNADLGENAELYAYGQGTITNLKPMTNGNVYIYANQEGFAWNPAGTANTLRLTSYCTLGAPQVIGSVAVYADSAYLIDGSFGSGVSGYGYSQHLTRQTLGLGANWQLGPYGTVSGAVIQPGATMSNSYYYASSCTFHDMTVGGLLQMHSYFCWLTNASVQAGGTMMLSYNPQATNVTVDGTLIVNNTAYATNVTVNPGGQVTHFKGGLIDSVLVKAGATLSCYKHAVASNVTTEAGAVLYGSSIFDPAGQPVPVTPDPPPPTPQA